MKEYVVRSAIEPVELGVSGHEGPWATAHVLHIKNYPWFIGGKKQATEVRALFDQRALYVQFRCHDSHIFSRTTELNGPVYEDSCVELFASIGVDRDLGYFNLEMNCCGVFHLGFGTGRYERKLISPELASRIRVVSSLPGPTRDESPDDKEWWVAAELPFDVLGEFTGQPARPSTGELWRGNFYRCGGKTDPQYGCWMPIKSSLPDFHRPKFFGNIRFV